MADNFGIKLGIDGEKAFKQALRDINANFKELGSEMKLATSQFEKNDKSVEALAARNTVLTKTITEQQNKIETLRKALQNAEESFGENDKRTQQWRIQLNNAEAELNNMERELKQNTEEVKDNSEAVKDSESKWGGLAEACKVAGATIAAAWAAASAAAVAAGKALVDATQAGATYSDEVLTQSQVTGIAADKLQEYMYAAELVDVSTETLTGSMAKNIRSMSSAAKGTGDAADAYKKLGVSVTDANGELRDSDTVYWELIEALGKVDNETERDALAMKVLGKSAQELNPLIKAGTDRMQELGQEARDMGYVLGGDTLEAYAAFDDNLQRLKNTAVSAKNAFGQVLLPTLTKLSTVGVDAMGKLSKGLNDANGDLSKIGDVIEDVLPEILDTVMEVVPELIEIVITAVEAIGKTLMDNMPKIIDTVMQLVSQVLNALVGMLPKVADAVMQLLKGVVKTIADNAKMIIKAVIDTISTLIGTIADSLPEIVDAIIEIISAVATSLIENLPTLVEALMKVITSLITTIADSLPKLISTLADIVVALVKQVPNIIRTLIENLDTIISSLLGAILDSIPELIQAAIDIAIALVEAAPDIIKELIKMVPKIISGLVDALTDPERLVDIVAAGGEIIVKLGEGIWNTIVKLGEAIIEFFKGIWETIKSIFKQNPLKTDKIIADAEQKYGVKFSADAKRDIERMAHEAFAYNGATGSIPNVGQTLENINLYIENYVANNDSDVEQFAQTIMTVAGRQAQRRGMYAY